MAAEQPQPIKFNSSHLHLILQIRKSKFADIFDGENGKYFPIRH